MNSNRLYELDGLRGIAACSVVIFHYFYNYNRLWGHDFSVNEFFRLGHYGVHLFFMISGFVIYWTILRSKTAFDFIWSRFSRLYPAYWAALTITALCVSYFGLQGRERDLQTVFANYLMFHEYLGFQNVDGVYWTLTLELSFYFWILNLYILKALDKINIVLMCWVSIQWILPLIGIYDVDYPLMFKLFLVDYIAFFGAGICFYQYWKKIAHRSTHILMLIIIASILGHYPTLTSIGFMLFFIVFYLLINHKLSLLRLPVFTYLGGISYSLYLIHQNIGYIIIQKGYQYGIYPQVSILIAVIVSLFLAHILVICVEKPSISYLRNRK